MSANIDHTNRIEIIDNQELMGTAVKGLSFFRLSLHKLTASVESRVTTRFPIKVQNGGKAKTINLVALRDEEKARFIFEWLLYMQEGHADFVSNPRRAIFSVMQYPRLLIDNGWQGAQSKLDFQDEYFFKSMAEFKAIHGYEGALDDELEEFSCLIGDLYGHQEFVLWNDISPTPSFLHLVQAGMTSQEIGRDEVLGMMEHHVEYQQGDKATWVFYDGHDGAIVFEKNIVESDNPNRFTLLPKFHSHSREVALDVARRIVGLPFDD